MESPGLYDDSPMDGDDVVYPCKGCGEILEEGKAFELAGNRWHIDCFRCHTCGTLLDSDANLLLLGDGSLICNNCTYSCSACGNKIEDLAILTGDQAFCAGCFRCRSCKRKIDNLRYARTSQGIFCMSCHESLMARRRKKARTKPTSGTNGATTTVEKALPSLPPGVAPESAFSPDSDTPQDPLSGTLRAASPSQRKQRRHDLSSLSDDDHRERSLSRPAGSYKDTRSPVSASDAEDGDAEQGFLPMAFDPNPVPRVPQRKRIPTELSPAISNDDKPHRDYFRRGEPSVSSRSASHERELLQNVHFPTPNQPKMSPHIAYQDKSAPRRRNASGQSTPLTHPTSSPIVASLAERDAQGKQHTPTSASYNAKSNEAFKLQDVPKERKNSARAAARHGSNSPRISPIVTAQRDTGGDVSPVSEDSDVNPFNDPKLKEPFPAVPTRHADRPMRGDSLAASRLASTTTSNRSSVDPSTPLASRQRVPLSHERQQSVSSVHTSNIADAHEAKDDITRPNPSLDMPPPRASSRPSAAQTVVNSSEFTAPRVTPTPHSAHQRSASSQQNEFLASPAARTGALPPFTSDGGFSLDKEMSRIMRGDRVADDHEPSTGLLRKVSNAVKHGRSFSDRGSLARVAAANNGAESSVASASTISSPLASPVPAQETIDTLRAQLRRAQHRIAELETEKVGLETKVNNSSVINEVNSELREKRTTMAFLDSQREIVVRELETMTRHLQKVKDQAEPLDLPTLKSDILEDFAGSMQKLKDHIGSQIEELMRKRNELTNEITDLIAMKDKGFQEYESLSSKNAQLEIMNHQLLHNIQEGFKANRSDARSNGLGIHSGARLDGSANDARLNILTSEPSMPNLLQGEDGESATMLPAPQVVNIRKGQVKKFNWRKGGERVAKGVKGIKGAFAGDKQAIDVSQIGLPYGMTQQAVSGGEQMYGRPQVAGERPFALFAQGQKNGRPVPAAVAKDLSGGVVTAADPSSLFGSELEARCEFEKRVIPGIVTRCIAEVESRGMRVEGIYRKSGGSGQVKSVQAGFDKDTNHDVSDPDLEIHAVTSALKQYFRKLPTPLITYDVYDTLLEAGAVADKERQVVALRHALSELPPHHRGCLEYLVRHLARVMSLERENLMTPLNLAVVFAPTIMRPLSIEREMSDGLAQRAAIQALLELHDTVFEEE